MDEPVPKNDAARDISLALLLAFTIRLLYLLISGRALDSADAIHYITMAQQFRAGDFMGFDENLPILYPALGALAALLVQNWEWAFWTVSLVFSTLTVWPVYLLSRELHGRSTARTMALLLCFWPWLVDYAGRVGPETLAVFFWLLSVWLVYRGIALGGWRIAAASASLFGLHLARPEGTFLMIAAPVAALALAYRTDRARYRNVAMLAGGVALLLLAYAVAMKTVVGTATLSYRAPMGGDVVDYFRKYAMEIPKTFLTLAFNVLPLMLGPFLLFFMGLGAFTEPEAGRKPRLEILLLSFCLVQFTLTVANFSPAPRYMMPVIIALSLWAAFGIVEASKRLRRHGNLGVHHLPIVLLIGTMCLGLTVELAKTKFGRMPSTPVEYRTAGHWMKDHLERGLIITRKPQIGFYADMPTTGPAREDGPAEVVALAARTGARYAVVDERYGVSIVPGLRPLLNGEQVPPEMTLLQDGLSGVEGTKVVIYEITVPGVSWLRPEDFPRPDSHNEPGQRRRRTAPEK